MAWGDDFSLGRFSPLPQVAAKSKRLPRMDKPVSGSNHCCQCVRPTGKFKDRQRARQTQSVSPDVKKQDALASTKSPDERIGSVIVIDSLECPGIRIRTGLLAPVHCRIVVCAIYWKFEAFYNKFLWHSNWIKVFFTRKSKCLKAISSLAFEAC